MKLPASSMIVFSISCGLCAGSVTRLMITAGPGTAVTALRALIPLASSSALSASPTRSGSLTMLL